MNETEKFVGGECFGVEIIPNGTEDSSFVRLMKCLQYHRLSSSSIANDKNRVPNRQKLFQLHNL